MSSISLSELEDIEGFTGSALVDTTSGLALAMAGSDPDLEFAVAGNTEVLMAQRKAAKALGIKSGLEDLLVTMDTEYHIIRPLTRNPELFIYLVLDKSKSSLAMARHVLKRFENNLDFS